MAIVCLRCKMWVIFLYIFTLSAASTTPELYRYDVQPPVDTEEVRLVLVKRDVPPETPPEGPTTLISAALRPPSTTSAPLGPPGGAMILRAAENTSSADQAGPGGSPVLSHNGTGSAEPQQPRADPPVAHLGEHNLGVNGTGRRKELDKVGDVLVYPTNGTLDDRKKDNGTDWEQDEENRVISHNTDDILNKTAQENNATKTEVDDHEYYKSSFTIDPTVGEKYWVNMSNLPNVKTNELLSQSHRRAATVKLSFEFPFYGHSVRNVTIATGGFLYTGEYVHSWLAATQYIAPLMANFDTSLSNDSYIRYADTGAAFTVQWERVRLQDRPRGGHFTFQATLFRSGDIVFVYRHVPVYIESIQDEYHPVKVGLSDAYIIDRTIFFVRRKTIYEYHRVNFNREDIKNWTVIYLSALPTCLSNKDCASCLSRPTAGFECSWCAGSGRCSTGMDRHRQDWLVKGCERKQLRDAGRCAAEGEAGPAGAGAEPEGYDQAANAQPPAADDPRQASMTNEAPRPADRPRSLGVSGLVSVLLVLGLLAATAMWLLYAYKNPHSASGQMLIRYRPSQWSWRRGEARYTAATIHM